MAVLGVSLQASISKQLFCSKKGLNKLNKLLSKILYTHSHNSILNIMCEVFRLAQIKIPNLLLKAPRNVEHVGPRPPPSQVPGTPPGQ